MTRTVMLRGPFALLLMAGFGVVWQLQKNIDVQRQSLDLEQKEVTLRSPGALKGLSLEYGPLLGALYWTRAVQYYGEKHRMHDRRMDDLWPLLDITTTLDPHLVVAYRLGAIFLTDARLDGEAGSDLAINLLERGIRENPDSWRLYQDLGNVYYFDKKDYAKAAEAYATGSRFPGTPIWMKSMAAKIASEGESLETSLFLWEELYRSTTDPQLKKHAETHIKLAHGELDFRELNRLADEYQKQTGRRATRIGDLVQAGLLPRAPVDADGFPYVLGEGGQAEFNPKSPLLEEQTRLNKKK